ncbi:MAG: hypothetical protein WAT66_11705, partial [Actinomycetota bacterium]
MEPLLISTVFGLGLLFVFDGLARPDAKIDPLARLKRMGPVGAAGAAGGTVALLATGWPVAVIGGAALGAVVPQTLRKSREDRIRLARREAIAEVSGRLRDAIRSGIG